MRLLAVMDQDCEVSARSGAVVVLRRGTVTHELPAHEVEEVHLYGGADVTAAGRNFLLARGIDTLFLTLDGRVRGRLVGWESAWAERRIAQYRMCADGARSLAIAKALITGKLENQRRLLLGRQKSLQNDAVADTLAGLRADLQGVGLATGAERLRGVEGLAAARYFRVWTVLLTNPNFAWEGRNRRPPRDPVNACLSYGYTLLVARCEHALRAAGLDPQLGVLHTLSRGAPALALDLAEPFRPLVDSLVLNLLNRRQLGPDDFAPPDAALTEQGEVAEDAVYLGDVGRKVFLRAWTQRLGERSPHPVLDGDWTLAGLFREIAHQLRRVIEGEAPEFVPPSLG